MFLFDIRFQARHFTAPKTANGTIIFFLHSRLPDSEGFFRTGGFGEFPALRRPLDLRTATKPATGSRKLCTQLFGAFPGACPSALWISALCRPSSIRRSDGLQGSALSISDLCFLSALHSDGFPPFSLSFSEAFWSAIFLRCSFRAFSALRTWLFGWICADLGL
jgi:hypothetical protein